MKNSLHSIKSGTRILSEEIDRLEKDDIKMFTRELSKSTENVYGIMENILLWMKSQADRLDVVEQDIAIHYMVSKIFELLSPAATQKNIHLINNTAEDDNVTADKDMLEFILRNLIQNAIKYSNKDGSVTVKSWRENNQLKISVSDNGIGIPEENLRTLFNSSNRFSRKGTSNEKGTGLGLVICNEFANRMDGSILCQSKEEGDDKGSVFTLILSDR